MGFIALPIFLIIAGVASLLVALGTIVETGIRTHQLYKRRKLSKRARRIHGGYTNNTNNTYTLSSIVC